MAKDSSHLDGGVKVGIPQIITTPGNVVSPVQGFTADAGSGKPPTVGPYGAVGEATIPSGEKVPGGNSKAIGAFFGSKNPGGGK